jgi:hypothetical protein
VAQGKVFPTVQGDVIHDSPLPVDCYRIQLTTVLEGGGKYKVPIPADEEEEEVERNHGYILAWSRYLVLLSGQVINFFTKLVNFQTCTFYLYIYIINYVQETPKKTRKMAKKIRSQRIRWRQARGPRLGHNR